MKNRGFTLIELLVVISIISLISSILLSNLLESRRRGEVAAGLLFESTVNAKIGDGLIASYMFDEGGGTMASDSAGGAPTLTSNSPDWLAKGVTGSGIRISSTDSDFRATNFTNMNYEEGTISFWVKPDSYIPAASQSPIINLGGGSDANRVIWISYMMQGGSNTFPGLWNYDGNWDRYTSLNTGTDPNTLKRKWNHVLITWLNSTGKIDVYLNGKKIGSQVVDNSNDIFTFNNGVSNYQINIGGDDNTNRYAEMEMDRVRIYNKYFEVN